MPELVAKGRAAMWVGCPVADRVAGLAGLHRRHHPDGDRDGDRPGPGGTSLDNTVRIVLADPTDDWILLDIESEGINRSIGCGRVRLSATRRHADRGRDADAIIRTSHHPTYDPAPPL